MERNIVYFPKPEMCVLWNYEFIGQMSDGVYENSAVTNTALGTKWWCSKAVVGDVTQNDHDCPYSLNRLVAKLKKYRIDRYISYCIFMTERPELFDQFLAEDTVYIMQVANSVWHANSLYVNELDDQFEERFKQQISYIAFEELKALFEKWSYQAAWQYTMRLVNEMDCYIH